MNAGWAVSKVRPLALGAATLAPVFWSVNAKSTIAYLTPVLALADLSVTSPSAKPTVTMMLHLASTIACTFLA